MFLYTNHYSHYFKILKLFQIRKKVIFAAVIIIFIPFIIKAEWVSLNKNNTIQKPPDVTLISDDNTGTILKIEIYGFELKNFSSGDHNYQMIDLLSESFTINPGYPELPYIAKILAIPDQAVVSIEVLETGEMQTFNNIHLPPARESWIEGSPESPYVEDQVAYSSLKSYPGAFAKNDPPSVFRDFRITRVSVFPIQYLPAKKELQVVNSITIRINYDGTGEVVNPKNTDRKSIAPSFGELYRSTIFNYQNVLDNLYGGKENGHELMLCIMPDDFFANFETYAEWKRHSGIDIHMTKFSDIGANSTNPDIIKSHIADAYLNWEVPPTYVLLVGDAGILPTYSSYSIDENFFVEIVGNDYFPEMMIGRLTNQSDYQMQVMINKFLLYEKTPYTASTDWFKKGICCSNDDYASQIETKRFAAERMLVDGHFFSVDTMMSDPGCTYSNADVTNAINEGRSFLNYRGEGWSSGWWATCTPFTTSQVSNLSNGKKFTFVTSIGCGVAMFGSGECFGETWLELGTLSAPRGACAFIGPTGITHTTYNNKIDKGIYVGMFHEGMDTPGQAILRGKLYMYNVFGNTGMVESHYKKYCILGDPSIHIWKDVPQAVTVDYPASIPFGTSTVEFTVTHSATGQPVSNALVCVTGNTQFATDNTNESGIAYVDVEAQELETFIVTVRGGNVIPFQGTLLVAPPTGPYVIKDSYIINDVSGGNGNGLMDYGETNLLSLTMINVGVGQAENVVVTINTNNPYITITDSIADYGSIAPGSTAVVTDGFAYSVASDIPDLEEVSIAVTATSGSDSWESFVLIEAHAPILEYVDFDIADPSGNNNGKLDPGETVDLIITLENSGSSLVMNVNGELTESDPFITVNSPQMSFGNIAGGGAQSNAIFSVSSDITTPAGHLVELTLILDADLGITGVVELDIIVGQVPVLIIDLDENHNSAPAMEDALADMEVTYEKLNSFPPDLNLYSTVFVCLGIFSQNHVLSTSEGQILADYLNNGGNIYMEGGDTWYYDSGTPVHNMFNINPTADGSSDMGTVLGIDDTFTEGMSFYYTGDNSWMDHIEPIAPAFKIFDNDSPSYGTGVAYDDGDYKTIGTSHEFGGLENGASPSTKEELMAQYLEFFEITISLQALFISNVTEVCENGMVEFYDQSSGNTISWQWIFEGGSPATSTVQNPTVLYANTGIYDVTLIVSDGTESDTLTLNDYINVLSLPGIPPSPEGPTTVCGNDEVSSYSTAGLAGIYTYEWLLEPADAGIVTGNGLTADIFWTDGYLGEATLKVAGENICGTGNYSDPITITRYLPEVTLEPFDWVCLDWPAFELSGGMPAGGECSGPGVENGWFDPDLAGVGTHTIIYTYTDPEDCENFATETILVDPCTGIDNLANQSGLVIYPNPTTGMIFVGFDQNIGPIEVIVVNTLNDVVYSYSSETLTKKKLNIDLSNLAKGVYFIKIKTDTMEKTTKVVLW